MYRIICLWLNLWFTVAAVAAEVNVNSEITPSDVYQKAYVIREELDILKRHFHFDKAAVTETLNVTVTPGHNWQKGYEILYKINLLRGKHGLSFYSVPSCEPTQTLPPHTVYEQMIRIIAELRFIKFTVNINDNVAEPPIFTGKNPTDVYHLLDEISHELDILNENPLSPSEAFAQAVRITEDVDFILEALDISSPVTPPPKVPGAKPADVFDVLLQVLAEIRRIQNILNIKGMEFYTLKPTGREITPSDIFSLDSIALAELQLLKARLGLKHALTPMAQYYKDIQPASPHQLHGWTLRKLKLIQSSDLSNIR